ncbi:MAG: hypothetical protein K0V04_06380 [Deltaproteobacteria bacterium]|nr:hypothetical protein [Deltaproteobacteria bacterium]
MMHGRIRLLASALAAVLTPAIALSAFVLPTQAQAAAPAPVVSVDHAKCQVHAVLASKEGNAGIPKELKFLETQLKDDEFAAYKSFRLIEQKALKLDRGKKTDVSFTSGNRLGLRLIGGDDKRLDLHADLSSRSGTKSLLATDYSIEDAGVLMIRAGSYTHKDDTGRLFFAIQCVRSK